MHASIATALMLCFLVGAESRDLAATSQATAIVVGPGSASSDCSAKNGNTAVCEAAAVSDGTRKAEAVSVGTAETADVVVKSLAKALGEGDGDTIAVAIGEAVKSAGGGAEAAEGLSDVFVEAVNEGAGLALAKGIADGVAKGGDVQKGIVAAIAKIIKDDGCDAIKSTFASAFSQASEHDNKQGFADAFDVDVQVSECLYPHCTDDRWHCCQSLGDESKCSAYTVFKTTPRTILTCKDCDTQQCICP